jgi:hypothetical protein
MKKLLTFLFIALLGCSGTHQILTDDEYDRITDLRNRVITVEQELERLKFEQEQKALESDMDIAAEVGASAKLSDLTELAVAPAEADEFYLNDGGVSKKITTLNLMRILEGTLTTFEIAADNLGIGTDLQAYDADLDTLSSPTAWRVFYSDAGGITQLPLGASGTYLKSAGASSAPVFDTPAGSGDVTGPSSSTDNSVAKFDSTTGKLIQEETDFVINDDGVVNESNSPTITFYDYSAAGAALDDKKACVFFSDMGTTTEDSEDADIWLECVQGGTHTEVFRFDESDDRVEFSKPVLATNVVGADITGSTNHDTVELHGVIYKATAAATVTLDAAADAGYGACASYRIRDAAETLTLDPQAGEKMNLAGTALAAGTAIEATGAGEYVTICATTDTDGSGTDGYDVYGPTSGWASE